MDDIFRVKDRWGRIVVLTEKQWTTHIAAEHPELRDHDFAIAETITAPLLVTHDRIHPNQEVFYRGSPLPRHQHALLCKVVVHYGVVGVIVTAYLIRRPDRREQRKWP
jgi:hypothetical protein